MTWGQKFFSFQGRMRRQDFWICSILLFIVSLVLNYVIGMFMGGPTASMAAAVDPSDPAAVSAYLTQMSAMSTGALICGLILLWPSLAVMIKRLHDRNQTGWLVLIMLIPLVNILFWLINLGILDGTPGPNKYGPSPKGLGEAAA